MNVAKLPEYKVFIFSSRLKSRRMCRWEIYLDGKLVRCMQAKDPNEARAVAAQYLESLQQSASDDA